MAIMAEERLAADERALTASQSRENSGGVPVLWSFSTSMNTGIALLLLLAGVSACGTLQQAGNHR